MKRLLFAAALCCALTLSAVAQAPAGLIFRDRHRPGKFYILTVSPQSQPIVTVTADGRGARSRLIYKTDAGVRCELFFRDGHIFGSRPPNWALFPLSPHVDVWIPDGHGGNMRLSK